jgi:hypothetical protein
MVRLLAHRAAAEAYRLGRLTEADEEAQSRSSDETGINGPTRPASDE